MHMIKEFHPQMTTGKGEAFCAKCVLKNVLFLSPKAKKGLTPVPAACSLPNLFIRRPSSEMK